MCWPMQALQPFVTGPDVLQQIVGWSYKECADVSPRFLILAAEHDVLCTPNVLLDATARDRAAFRHCIKAGSLQGLPAAVIKR